MQLLADLLKDKYYTVSYRNFCRGLRANDKFIQQEVQTVREQIKTRNVVFTDWEHHRVMRYDPAYNFIGFKNILGEYFDTKKWAVSVPTFGNNDFGERQISNLDFLIYVNGFNKEFNAGKIDHSNKSKEFLFLPGKPHPFRVYLLKELLANDLLSHSIWSASNDFSWHTLQKTLSEEYEVPEWRNKKVNGSHSTTRQVHFPMYNDSVCSIVSETMIDNDCHYITEKTCKPIMAEHLFVTLSGMGFLKNLRDLGFKTFHEHVDESYDECPNLTDRVNGIVKTCNDIRSMNVDKLYRDTKEIRKHNRELFFEEKYYANFNQSQASLLATYFQS